MNDTLADAVMEFKRGLARAGFTAGQAHEIAADAAGAAIKLGVKEHAGATIYSPDAPEAPLESCTRRVECFQRLTMSCVAFMAAARAHYELRMALWRNFWAGSEN